MSLSTSFCRVYYVIAVKIVDGVPLKDAASYKVENLKKYNRSSDGTPYIAAVLTKDELEKKPEFVLGNGGVTAAKLLRQRRTTQFEEYTNVKLDPDANYTAFISAYSSKVRHPVLPDLYAVCAGCFRKI